MRENYKILQSIVVNYLQLYSTNNKLSGEKWFFVVNFPKLILFFVLDTFFIRIIKGNEMFRGASTINLDTKGRIAIPTRYRPEIFEKDQGQMVCTVDIRQPCLLLYPLTEWEIIEQKLLSLSNFDPTQRSLQRVMLGYATECELDKNGRILLSAPLRQHANLDKTIMLVGQLNKFEVWSDAEWQAQIEKDIELGSSGEFAISEALRSLSL